jgi:hypothetical protein
MELRSLLLWAVGGFAGTFWLYVLARLITLAVMRSVHQWKRREEDAEDGETPCVEGRGPSQRR